MARRYVNRTTLGWILAAATLSLGWAQACAVAHESTPALAHPRTPFGLHVADSSTASETSASLGLPLELGDFRPLLSHAELATVAKAVDEERWADAAAQLSPLVQADVLGPGERRRLQFLLGTIAERAQSFDSAVLAYRASAAEPWELSPYIALALGRTLLAKGDAKGALAEFRQIPDGLPLAEGVRRLTARAAERSGDRDLAIVNYRAVLTRDPRPADFVDLALTLGAALLERAAAAGTPVKGSAPKAAVGESSEPERAERAEADRVEALGWARRARWPSSDEAIVGKAQALEQRAATSLSAAARARLGAWSPDDQIAALTELTEARRFSDARVLADEVWNALPASMRFAEAGCEFQILRAKAMSGERQWGKATDFLGETTRRCTHGDEQARALFAAGTYAFADKRYAAAIGFFAQLEKAAPQHRLADDARFKGALAELEMGNEARYTSLLLTIATDYPGGDVSLDGAFHLAMRRIEKGDWSGAASVLEGAAEVARGTDGLRGTEFSGRERYFHARAGFELGEKERALDQFEAIVRELPLSYYMLHAYSRLKAASPERAERAKQEAMALAEQQPFTFARQPEFATPGFRRAMELLRQGQFEWAEAEMRALGLLQDTAAPALLWASALLYDRAGAVKASHRIARGLLTDWLGRWPTGDWRRAWELAFPRPYLKVVERLAKENALSPALIYGVMREESQFDEKIVSHAGAHGLMQLMPATARAYGEKAGVPYSLGALGIPANNIALGAAVLKDFSRPFATNPLLCIPAYNAGPGRPKRWRAEHPGAPFDVWVELIPFRETRRYTHRVIAARAAYGYLYGEDPGSDKWLSLPD